MSAPSPRVRAAAVRDMDDYGESFPTPGSVQFSSETFEVDGKISDALSQTYVYKPSSPRNTGDTPVRIAARSLLRSRQPQQTP